MVIEAGTVRKLGCGFLFAFYSNWRYVVSFARYSDLLVENRKKYYTTPVFSAPTGGGGDPVGISRKCLMLIKLE